MVIRFLYAWKTEEPGYFFPADVVLIFEKIKTERGLFLFSGPTGSGKTTLMYHIARQVQGRVITIEDPVEIEEPAFLQLQTNDKIDQTYDQLIKLSLRHRPDLLIIGEIRDKVTAKAAVRAALTGHTVLATVHAKGVKETKSRFIDLVGQVSELENCLNGVVYQELFLTKDAKEKALLAYEFYDETNDTKSWQSGYQEVKEEIVSVDEQTKT